MDKGPVTRLWAGALAVGMLCSLSVWAQTPEPVRAQREYKKRHDKFAESLPALAGTGSLTKRMARSNERGDYTVGFRTQKDGFILTMTPKQMDGEHRSFYAEEDGVIHGDDQKAADASSPKVK